VAKGKKEDDLDLLISRKQRKSDFFPKKSSMSRKSLLRKDQKKLRKIWALEVQSEMAYSLHILYYRISCVME